MANERIETLEGPTNAGWEELRKEEMREEDTTGSERKEGERRGREALLSRRIVLCIVCVCVCVCVCKGTQKSAREAKKSGG